MKNVIPVAVCCWLLVACSQAQKTPTIKDFNLLCELYKSHVDDPRVEFDKIVDLTFRVDKEIPRLSTHFYHIGMADEDKKYQLYQTIAKQLTGEEWQCPVMEKYYIEQHKLLQKAQSEMN